MPKVGYCRECRREVWVTDAGCANGHPAGCLEGVREVPPPHVPQAAAPPPLPVPEKPPSVARLSLRRALWTVYALPATLIFLGGSVSGLLGGQRVLFAADLVLSLPLYAVVFLHAWDKRTLNALLWRAYAFGFVVWQVGFALLTGAASRPAAALPAFMLQLPMLVAVFRYAFRKWPAEVDEQAQSAEKTVAASKQAGAVRLAALCAIAAVLGVFAVTIYGLRYRDSLRELLPAPPVYVPSVAPPAKLPPRSVEPSLAPEEALRLRTLFENQDFASLDASFTELQAAFERDPMFDRKVGKAFYLFTTPTDGARLNAWVAHSPSNFAPYEARAAYRNSMAARTAGSGSARTAKERSDSIRAWEEKASADVADALERNPRVITAYETEMTIHRAEGDVAAADKVFARARDLFPHSYGLYINGVLWASPRSGGSYEEMDRLAREGLEDNPQDPRFYRLFGFIYEEQADALYRGERYARSLELYTKALAYGDTESLLRQRAYTYLYLDDTPRAQRDAERLLELYPWSIGGLLLRAEVYLRTGDREGAARSVKTAETLSPDDSSIVEWKAWAKKTYGLVVR